MLERAHRKRPRDADMLAALASIERERGHAKTALAYARELAALDPGDAGSARAGRRARARSDARRWREGQYAPIIGDPRIA